MNWKAKIRYFIDYYLKFVIFILLVALFIGSFVKSMVFNRKEEVLSVMILSEQGELDVDVLEEELRTALGTTSKKQDISFTMLNAEAPQNEPVILTRLRARSVDLLITQKTVFDVYARQGVYADLSKALPAEIYENLEERLFFARTEETDDEGNVMAKGERAPFGIDFSGNRRYEQAGGTLEEPVIGIVSNTEHEEAAKKAISYFFE